MDTEFVRKRHYSCRQFGTIPVIFLPVKPTAKRLILQLFVASGDKPLPVRSAVSAAALFGISENNVRVAFARLASEGRIEPAGRGEYREGDGAAEFAREIASWRRAESRLRKWNGDYAAVHQGALGRSDRPALKRRIRALGMLGFAEIERGLWMRPNNLEGSVDALRTRLHALGLDTEAPVFVMTHLAPGFDKKARSLWNGKALTASYARTERQIENWLESAQDLDLDEAARHSFLLGGNAIRQIVFDPLLPGELVDVEARHSFFESVRRIDEEGHRIWKRFFTSRESRWTSALDVSLTQN